MNAPKDGKPPCHGTWLLASSAKTTAANFQHWHRDCQREAASPGLPVSVPSPKLVTCGPDLDLAPRGRRTHRMPLFALAPCHWQRGGRGLLAGPSAASGNLRPLGRALALPLR